MNASDPGQEAGRRMAMQSPGDGAESPALTPPTSEGAASVHQGLTTPPSQLPQAPDNSYLDALTLPQRRYLACIQGGADPQAARSRAGANVFPATVLEWLRTSPQYARAHDAIQAGLAVMGVEEARRLAIADMPDIVGHWTHKARYAERDRDQAQFGRLAGEAAGLLGQGARMQVNVETTQVVRLERAPGARVPLGYAPVRVVPDALPTPDPEPQERTPDP